MLGGEQMTKTLFGLCICVCAGLMAGCDKIGQTPAGGTDAEVRAFFDSQPLEVRAKQIMSSPAPMDAKIQRIKDMYKKEGKEPPAELLQGGGMGR